MLIKDTMAFRFCDLPKDVRMMIYDICLIDARDLNISYSSYNGLKATRDGLSLANPFLNLALLQLDTTSRYEAIPVFYSATTFHFWSFKCFLEFKGRLSRAASDNLQSLQFLVHDLSTNVPSNEWTTAGLEVMRRLPRLRHLHIRLPHDLLASTLELLHAIRSRQGQAMVSVSAFLMLRSARVDEEAMSLMQQWGWKLSSELVPARIPPRMETLDDMKE